MRIRRPSLLHAQVLLQGLALAGMPALMLARPADAGFPFAYLGFLPLLWVALRWGFRGAALGASLFLAATGVHCVALGLDAADLRSLPLFLIVAVAATLAAGYGVDARQRHRKASETHFRQLVDQSLIPTAVHQDGRFIYANDAALQLLGYSREELLGQLVDVLIHPDELEDSHARRARAIHGDAPDAVERQLLRKDGSIVAVDLLTIACQHQGRPAAQVLAVDLTAHKAVQEALLLRIKEKELLLREIHHRVKNNLQVVSSLLRLQSALHPSPELHRALEDAQSRIQAISAVHQRLHQAPNLAPGDLQDYVSRLVGQLVQTFAAAPSLIQAQVVVEPLALDADQLVPLGLIIHELVMNALRHAYPPGHGGIVRLELRAEGGELRLRVCDEGSGLPSNMDPFQNGGLGFQMVRALADQLKGRLNVDTASGTAISLRFPAPAPFRP